MGSRFTPRSAETSTPTQRALPACAANHVRPWSTSRSGQRARPHRRACRSTTRSRRDSATREQLAPHETAQRPNEPARLDLRPGRTDPVSDTRDTNHFATHACFIAFARHGLRADMNRRGRSGTSVTTSVSCCMRVGNTGHSAPMRTPCPSSPRCLGQREHIRLRGRVAGDAGHRLEALEATFRIRPSPARACREGMCVTAASPRRR